MAAPIMVQSGSEISTACCPYDSDGAVVAIRDSRKQHGSNVTAKSDDSSQHRKEDQCHHRKTTFLACHRRLDPRAQMFLLAIGRASLCQPSIKYWNRNYVRPTTQPLSGRVRLSLQESDLSKSAPAFTSA